MIICFSGTGNTRVASDELQKHLGDEMVRLAPGLMKNLDLVNLNADNDRVIWTFPVHCWAPPKKVIEAIKSIKITNDRPITHHMICSCGDDIGLADKIWAKAVRSRGWAIGHRASVQMPNTYTSLPKFDVDPQEVAEAKLSAMPARMEAIAADIASGNWGVDVVRGRAAWAKTRLLFPLFKAFLSSTKAYHVNDQCGGCGRCARNCPMITIQIVDGKPVWGKDCTMCMRCYHCCPHHAVEYGPYTKGKGQYICPGFSIKQ